MATDKHNGPVRGDLGPPNRFYASSVDDAAWRSIDELEAYARAASTFAQVWDTHGMKYALRKARAHAANALQLLELAESALEVAKAKARRP